MKGKKKHIKVLYISYDGITDPLGSSQVLPYILRLSEKGVDITLLSFEKEKNYNKNNEYVAQLLENAGISWVSENYTKYPPVLSTFYDVYKMKKTASGLHKEKAFDIIHCRSYIASLVGLKLKNKTGVKFLFDMRGFWADERVEGGLWNL
ncbi:MAG: hypothetical protein ABEH43_06090, partial [Flavobacteriales bacterium]